MKTGDIYSKKRESDGKYVVFKIVQLENTYVLVALFESDYEERPKTIEIISSRKLVPVTDDGWKVLAVKPATLESWDLELLCNEENTEEETTMVEGWLALCGPEVMKPL